MSAQTKRIENAVLIAIALLLIVGIWATSPSKAHGATHPIDTKAKRAAVKQIKRAAHDMGLGRADTRALIVLAGRESDYNPRCVTGSYVGVLQVPHTGWIVRIDWKRSKKHPHGRKNGTNRPRWQDAYLNTRIAIKQIQKRYKTPRRALAHSYSCGWY